MIKLIGDTTKADRSLVYEVPEAGEMLGLTRAAAYAAAKRGDIPTIRIGKTLRVPKAAFEKMLAEAGAR
jgi:excisionase family DNA binding protein